MSHSTTSSPKTILYGTLESGRTLWSAEKMLDGQHQRLDILPLPELLAEKTGRGSLLNCPSCPPDDPIGRRTELTEIILFTLSMTVIPHLDHFTLKMIKFYFAFDYLSFCFISLLNAPVAFFWINSVSLLLSSFLSTHSAHSRCFLFWIRLACHLTALYWNLRSFSLSLCLFQQGLVYQTSCEKSPFPKLFWPPVQPHRHVLQFKLFCMSPVRPRPTVDCFVKIQNRVWLEMFVHVGPVGLSLKMYRGQELK